MNATSGTREFEADLERLATAAEHGDAGARIDLGWTYECLGRTAEATRQYERVGDDARALRHLWLLNARAGHMIIAGGFHAKARKAGDEYAGRTSPSAVTQEVAKRFLVQSSADWYRTMTERHLPRAEAGDVDAMRLLGEITAARGERFAAADWFGRAAEAGDPKAREWAGDQRRAADLGFGARLLLCAAVLLGVGIWLVQPDSAPTVTAPVCDNQTMGPGDTCIAIGGGGTSFTYEERMGEQRAALAAWPGDQPGDEVAGWMLIAAAGAAGAVGVARAVRS